MRVERRKKKVIRKKRNFISKVAGLGRTSDRGGTTAETTTHQNTKKIKIGELWHEMRLGLALTQWAG